MRTAVILVCAWGLSACATSSDVKKPTEPVKADVSPEPLPLSAANEAPSRPVAIDNAIVSPDHRWMVTYGYSPSGDGANDLRVWDAQTGALRFDMSGGLEGEENPPMPAGVVFSKDGATMVVFDAMQSMALAVDMETGKVVQKVETPNYGRWVFLMASDDARFIVADQPQTGAFLLDLAGGGPAMTMVGDGETIPFRGGWIDDTARAMHVVDADGRFWVVDLETGQGQKGDMLESSSVEWAYFFNDDRRHLITWIEDKHTIWDLEAPKAKPFEVKGRFDELIVDGRFLAAFDSAGPRVIVWDAVKGEKLAEVEVAELARDLDDLVVNSTLTQSLDARMLWMSGPTVTFRGALAKGMTPERVFEHGEGLRMLVPLDGERVWLIYRDGRVMLRKFPAVDPAGVGVQN